MSESTVRGRFLWYDLLTPDVDAAVRFYTQALGWETEVWDGGGEPYTMWTAGGRPIGGVVRLPDEAAKAGAPPHWVSYIGTPDVDGAGERIRNAGGKELVPAVDVDTVGRFSSWQDPQGGVFAIFTPEQIPNEEDGLPAVGHFSWHELAAGDLDAAFAFYADLFDWKKLEAMDMGEAGIYQLYGRGGPAVGGMYAKPDEMPVASWCHYVRVEDIEARVEAIRRLGGTMMVEPMEVPGGDYVAVFKDPQGAVCAVHEMKS